MLITTGKVTDGKIQLETSSLPDGTTVTVLAPEGDETFALNVSEQEELMAAISEAEGGELVSVTKVLQSIRHS